jgi:hypothetical protein
MKILRDLISQGFTGDELLTKFAEMRAGISAAIVSLIEDADEIAAGNKKAATLNDIETSMRNSSDL